MTRVPACVEPADASFVNVRFARRVIEMSSVALLFDGLRSSVALLAVDVLVTGPAAALGGTSAATSTLMVAPTARAALSHVIEPAAVEHVALTALENESTVQPTGRVSAS